VNDLFEHLREEMEERGMAEHFVAFQDWQDNDIKSILGLGNRVSYSAGEQVLEMGSEEDRDIYIVITGALDAYQDVGGGEKRLTLMGPGDLFGEMSFVDGSPRSANVRALEDSLLLRIRPEDLDSFCAKEPKVALMFVKEIAKILSSRLRRFEAS
jgi:CRP-like cAMP-binding protein